jgi:hypothetical protein
MRRSECGFKPRQAKVLTGGGDLREAQVDVPLSVSHSAFDRNAGLNNSTLTLTGEYAYANDFEVRLRASTDLASA